MSEKGHKNQPLQARSRETVKAILEATTRILGRDGLKKLSTNRIAEVAGVSVGSVYQFFRNKDSILHELFSENFEKNLRNLLATVEQVSPRGEDGSVELRPFFSALIGTVFENFEKRGAVASALLEHAPALIGFRHVEEMDARITPVFLRYLEESGMKIRPEKPETAVFILIQSIRAAVAVAYARKTPPDEIARIKAELVELCVRYLEPAGD